MIDARVCFGARSGVLAGLTKDYAVRMQEWFDHFLQGKPAPAWMQDGVPRLQMEQHLRDRKPLLDPKAKVEAKKIAM